MMYLITWKSQLLLWLQVVDQKPWLASLATYTSPTKGVDPTV